MSEGPETLRIWLLGGFRVSASSRPMDGGSWRSRKAAGLVKLLALVPAHRLHREQVMDALWPDSAAKAASNNLRQVLYAARRILAPASYHHDRYLMIRDQHLLLCPEGRLWVDVDAFEEAAAQARRARDPAAYRAAIDLYAGDLLPDDRYEEWAEGRRAQLRQLYLALLLELAWLHEERHERGPAAEALRAAIAEEPTLEEAHESLMRLHALSGRPEEALAQYERLRDARYRVLGIQPGPGIQRLRDEIAAGRFPPTPPADPSQEEQPVGGEHNLPAPRTSFVGRQQEMLEVKRALAMTQLLTLTGAGGCGKTCLALEVGREQVSAYPDGVWLARLAPLSEPELVPQAVAAALGAREQPGRPLLDNLLHSLRDRQMLLILDNCEHLIGATTQLVETLLDSCPRLRVLATSRAPMGVAGELVWPVPPLSAPGSQHSPTVEELEGYESARLFTDRASMRHQGFELTDENAAAVAEVCVGLEGIPLAIELAAARVGVLSAGQISERLGNSLTLLTGGERTSDHRHQTLRAALDWSYELLEESERVLFRRLCIFAGGFTPEAAESIGAGGDIEEEDVLDLLSMLVDKSLVVSEESWGSGARYRLLEPVRQYCREKLEGGRKADEVRRRHAEWYLRFAEEAKEESSGPVFRGWLEQLEAEHDNLRAALGWSLERGDAELSLRMAGSLWLFWFTHGYSIEGRGWLEKSILLDGPPAARAKALNGAGWICMFQGDFETAKTLLEESLALYRELNDEEGIASSLSFLGHVALLGQRDDIPVAGLLEEALTLKPRIKNRRTTANMLVTAGIAAGLLRGDLGEAAELFEEAQGLYREMGDTWGMITCLINLGLISVILEHNIRAKVLLREVMQLSRELDERIGRAYSFFGLACVAASEGHATRAARLWGMSEAVREAAGIEIMPSTYFVTSYENRLTGARTRLGEVAFEEAWEMGKAMPLEAAVEYALAEKSVPIDTPQPERTPVDEQPTALTSREREVALLVARGLTNRQISTEISISERTAANHVAKILRKLGLSSRVQIATWASESGLTGPDRG